MEVTLPVPRKDFIVNCLVQVPRCYTTQDRLRSGEGLKNGQSQPGKEWHKAHLIIGHLNQFYDAVGKVQIPIWIGNVACEVHHRFCSEKRIYNHVFDCPGLNKW